MIDKKYNQYTKEINQKLQEYMEIVLKENEVMNLTAITEKDEFVEKHFYDSLLPTEAIDFNNKKIIDIGSGAGFPGIPLAICYGNSEFTLLEPMNKRANFLISTIVKLGLKNVKVVCKRAEDLTTSERESFDIVLSRAVSALNILLELSLPYLKCGGFFVAYKGGKYQTEIDDSKKALKILNSHIISILNRKLPLTKEERFNIIITKEKSIDKKFPRNFSQIKSKPL